MSLRKYQTFETQTRLTMRATSPCIAGESFVSKCWRATASRKWTVSCKTERAAREWGQQVTRRGPGGAGGLGFDARALTLAQPEPQLAGQVVIRHKGVELRQLVAKRLHVGRGRSESAEHAHKVAPEQRRQKHDRGAADLLADVECRGGDVAKTHARDGHDRKVQCVNVCRARRVGWGRDTDWLLVRAEGQRAAVDAREAVRAAVRAVPAILALALGTFRIDMQAPIPRILELVGARIGILRRGGVSPQRLSALPWHAVGRHVRPRPRLQRVEACGDAPETGSPVAGEYDHDQNGEQREGLVVDRQAHLPALEDAAAACQLDELEQAESAQDLEDDEARAALDVDECFAIPLGLTTHCVPLTSLPAQRRGESVKTPHRAERLAATGPRIRNAAALLLLIAEAELQQHVGDEHDVEEPVDEENGVQPLGLQCWGFDERDLDGRDEGHIEEG
eukprot:scaffold2493_cov62-Phaeocystis_antarctica.AAC.5